MQKNEKNKEKPVAPCNRLSYVIPVEICNFDFVGGDAHIAPLNQDIKRTKRADVGIGPYKILINAVIIGSK